MQRRTLLRLALFALLASCLGGGTACLLPSCVADDESPFARRPAFFRFSPVTAAPSTLLPALSSPGEWCTITKNTSQYVFKSPTGRTDTYPLSQLDQYGSASWVSGLIVGTPVIADLGSDVPQPVCYDLVCPSCFEQDAITRSVAITDVSLGRASCGRCHRVYDLQNSGIVLEGAAGPKDLRLYRYRCAYNNNTFVVQN